MYGIICFLSYRFHSILHINIATVLAFSFFETVRATFKWVVQLVYFLWIFKELSQIKIYDAKILLKYIKKVVGVFLQTLRRTLTDFFCSLRAHVSLCCFHQFAKFRIGIAQQFFGRFEFDKLKEKESEK